MTKYDEKNLFGDVTFAYSREQAIEDGFLVDISTTAREAGFTIPVAVTEAVWKNYIEWTAQDTDRQTMQDKEGRLWDVLQMLRFAINQNENTDCIQYHLYIVPRDGKSLDVKLIKLKAMVGAGDYSEPVITIMLPHED